MCFQMIIIRDKLDFTDKAMVYHNFGSDIIGNNIYISK